MILTIIIFVLTLVLLMFIHEFGHFIMAKKFGIKVLEFGLGIPPKVWGKKWGETEVSLNLLPIGAFVRLLGEDEPDKKLRESKHSFAVQNVWKKIAVVVGGVVMTLLLSWLLFYIVLGLQGFKTQFLYLTEHQFLGATQSVESRIYIREVAKDSPAQKALLKEGERILALNGESLKDSEELISKTNSLAGQKIKLTLVDDETSLKREVEITPRVSPPEGQGPMGVSLFGPKVVNLEYKTPVNKILAGPIHSINVSTYSFKILGNVISQAFQTKNLEPVAGTVSGPVGITSIANQILTTSKNPLVPYLDFIALIALNLTIFNLLPIPALDGGRLFFLLIEAITKRKVNADIERWIHTVGMVLLLTLALIITLSDIRKIFGS